MTRSMTDVSTLPPGWNRQQLTVPTALAHEFRGLSAAEGYGGAKNLGTAALALFCGLPDRAKEALVEWVILQIRRDPARVTPGGAWEVVVESLRDGETGEWYLDRVLDPEVTPRPGAKASDAAKKRGRSEAG